MEKDLVKRMVKKDGSQRISFYRDEYADSPRYNTDEPLHCEDWSRDYTIMTKDERESKSSNARKLLEYMINSYVDYKKIIDFLVENGKHMTDGCCKSNDALVYNKSEHRWDLMSDMFHYNSETRKNEMGWCLNNHYYEKKYYIDLCGLLDDVCDSTIDYFAQNFLTDEIKIMSYSFDYYGSVSFYHEVSTDSKGICWLEKDEFLKYAGGDNSEWVKKEEQVWKEKSLDEIEFLLGELKAWCDNEVYGFVIEDAVRIQGIKTYYNGEREDEPYIDTQWEEADSCWSYYGDIDKVEGWIFEEFGLNKEDFEEVDV